MRPLGRLGWAVCVLVGCSFAVGVGSSDGAENRNLRFTRLLLEDGLSQSYVTAILQDRTGFMWFGTEDGLNRYDGYDFTVYKHDPHDPSSLSNSFVHAIYQDRAGALWVGTDQGLNRWVPARETFVRYMHDPAKRESLSDNRVQTIFEDSDRGLWIGTEGGLNLFDRNTERFTRYVHSPTNPTSLSDNRVWRIYEDSRRFLWIGTDGGGLNRLDRASGFFLHYRHDPRDPASISHDQVRAILEDEGRLWVGTYGGGLNLLDHDTNTFLHLKHYPGKRGSLGDDRVNAIFRDSDGVLWIGTESGLSEWRKGSRSFVTHRNNPSDFASLSHDMVRSIYQDKGDVLWVGTKVGGLSRRNPSSRAFAHYKPSPDAPASLSDPVVTSFYEDRDGAVWVGTFGGGLNRWDPDTSEFEQFRHDPARPQSLSSDRVMSILVDRSGVLWVGTLDGGLNRVKPDGRSFTRFAHVPGDDRSLHARGVTSLHEDTDGGLWVGTFGGGLHRLLTDAKGFAHIGHDPASSTSLSSDWVTALREDREGFLWVGTEGGGLNRCDRGTGSCTSFRHDPDDPDSLSSDVVWCIFEDSRDSLWIGTQGGGLNRLIEGPEGGPARFKSYTERDGLSNGFVYGILEDERGHLWLSTNRGLSRFDPEKESFRNFGTNHGLQSNEFNFGAYYRTERGEMLFGGIDGFNAFYPNEVWENTHVPRVVFTRYLALDEPVTLAQPVWDTEQVKLAHDDYVVTFEFAALDYAAPSANRYAYKLDGFHGNWIDLGKARRVTFTNLDPGGYTLRVKGANNDGVWNDEGASLSVLVLPPLWRTWWAYVLYVGLAVFAVRHYSRRHQRRLEREASYSHRLEQEVAERTKELADGYEKLEKLNQRLEEASVADSLTGLRNRRYVFDNIDKELSTILRLHDSRNDGAAPGARLIFLMLDLDGYKQINDQYGHDVGDDVLIQIRRILEDACRSSDTLVRWGGDEFLVIGHVSDQKHGNVLAERIHNMVRDHGFGGGTGPDIRTTCSIGFACYPFFSSSPTALSWEQVLTLADRALYLAKNNGRNAWVGIFSGDDEAKPSTTDDLLQSMLERPEELLHASVVEVTTSLSGELDWNLQPAKVRVG